MQHDTEILTGKNRFALETKPSIMVHERIILSLKAKAAASFTERWGMVAAEDGGEDSAGRAKLRLSSSEEVIARACEMADLLFESFEARGWLIQTPSMEELEKKYEKEKEIA